MRAVRIILTQSQANYRKEESVKNKMTYPLPPLSTIIGAIHNACGYIEYHPMDLSVQGRYESMQEETYTDYAFLNSTMNDRGKLVKMKNSAFLSSAFEVAAEACSQGADFEKEIKIDVKNRELLDEYQQLRIKRHDFDSEKKEVIIPALNEIKEQIKSKKNNLKELPKNSEEYADLKNEISEFEKKLKHIDENYNDRRKSCDIEYAKFASLTTSLRYYEVLYGIYLVIHIVSDEATMNDIIDNVYNIKSIGRSEDFVSVQSAEYVELMDSVNDEISDELSAYLPCNAINNAIVTNDKDKMSSTFGTKYFINKNYSLVNGKRIFNKIPVVYTSGYSIDDESELGHNTGIYYDGKFIVGLV